MLQHGLEYCRSLGVADKEDAELLGNQIKSNKTKFLISAAEDISQRLQSHSQVAGGHGCTLAQAAREACKSLTPLNFGIWVNRLRMYKSSLTMTECSFDK